MSKPVSFPFFLFRLPSDNVQNLEKNFSLTLCILFSLDSYKERGGIVCSTGAPPLCSAYLSTGSAGILAGSWTFMQVRLQHSGLELSYPARETYIGVKSRKRDMTLGRMADGTESTRHIWTSRLHQQNKGEPFFLFMYTTLHLITL